MPLVALLAIGAYVLSNLVEKQYGLLGALALGFLTVGVKTRNTACLSIGAVALVVLGQSALG
ncbi:hypothetical protein ACIO3O_06895 [Streptomyces sp. NPDC087440]|uniref:hypothetical protein n=1 Tax=Streptomyces sp. NPDC087440 TaxID=3365790 RepID=UPI0037F8739B